MSSRREEHQEKGNSGLITVYLGVLGTLVIALMAAIVLVLSGKPMGWSTAEAQESESTTELMTETTTEMTTTEETTTEEPTKAANGKIVYLDAGHGGYDPGTNVMNCTVKESEITFAVMTKLKEILEKNGYKVVAREDKEVYLDLSERAAASNASGADIMVSIHVNAEGKDENGNEMLDGQASGIQTHYLNKDEQSAVLAQDVQSWLIADTHARDRELVIESDQILRESSAPAVLIETGFITNKSEREKLTSDDYQQTLAEAIAKGIDQYFDLGEAATTTQESTEDGSTGEVDDANIETTVMPGNSDSDESADSNESGSNLDSYGDTDNTNDNGTDTDSSEATDDENVDQTVGSDTDNTEDPGQF